MFIDKAVKFADDTKMAHRVSCPVEQSKLQHCINLMYEWSIKWAMQFNVPKCKVVHLGMNNPNHDYVMNGEQLATVDSEKDIGVTVNKTLKPSEHCNKAAGTAMAVLYQLLRTFHYRDKVIFVKLYKTYVRPHLEFSAPVWNPWLQKDIDRLERVQRKFV